MTVIEKIQELKRRAATPRIVAVPILPPEHSPAYDAARPVVLELEPEAQGGDWKFHQAYGRLIKAHPEFPKWQIGLAIHQVIADERSK